MYTCFHNLNGPMGQSIKKQKIPKCSRTHLEAQCTLLSDYNQSEDNFQQPGSSLLMKTVFQQSHKCGNGVNNFVLITIPLTHSYAQSHTHTYIYSSLSCMVIVTGCNECPM